MALNIALTIVVGLVAGMMVRRAGLPAGGLVGSFAAVAVLSVLTGLGWLPKVVRIVVQIVAGAFVGCSIRRDELRAMGRLIGPAALMLGWYLGLTLGLGLLVHGLCGLDLATALMGCVPGGISDIPVVAASMGANAPDVTLIQLARLFLGVGLLVVAGRSGRKEDPWEQPGGTPSDRVPEIGPEASRPQLPAKGEAPALRLRRLGRLLATLAVATAGGLVGFATGVPGMTFTLAIGATLAFNLATGLGYVSPWLKRLNQYVAGSYLGAQVTLGDVAGFSGLLMPMVLVLAGYALSYRVLGWLQSHLFGFSRQEGRLIAVPAGASDIAMVLDDLGITSTDIVLLQVIRLVAVLGFFPQVVNGVLFLWP